MGMCSMYLWYKCILCIMYLAAINKRYKTSGLSVILHGQAAFIFMGWKKSVDFTTEFPTTKSIYVTQSYWLLMISWKELLTVSYVCFLCITTWLMYVSSSYSSHYNNSNHHRIASKPKLVGICSFHSRGICWWSYQQRHYKSYDIPWYRISGIACLWHDIELLIMHTVAFNEAKQKHLGCKKARPIRNSSFWLYMRLKALISAKAKN